MNVEQFISRLQAINEERPGANTFYPPVEEGEFERWKRGHIGHAIPEDLLQLLRKSNGLGIDQQWFNGKPLFSQGWGAFRIYSLSEIKRLDLDMYGEKDATGRFKHLLSFGCGPDASIYFAFDSKALHFIHIEPIVPEEATVAGPKIDVILDKIMSEVD